VSIDRYTCCACGAKSLKITLTSEAISVAPSCAGEISVLGTLLRAGSRTQCVRARFKLLITPGGRCPRWAASSRLGAANLPRHPRDPVTRRVSVVWQQQKPALHWLADTRVNFMWARCIVQSPRHLIAKRSCSTNVLNAAEATLGKLGGDGSVDLDFTRAPHVAFLSLNNPTRANAISCKMMLELRTAVNNLMQWKDGRAVVLQGSGKTFCSGADLRGSDEFFTAEAGAAMNAVMTSVTQDLSSLPLISVASIEGAAIGGGAELSTCCDFRVMASDATVQFIHVTRGVTPGWGGITRLVDISGRKQALYMLASGVEMDASLASAMQLVDAIVMPTEAMPMQEHVVEFLRPVIHLDNGAVTTTSLHQIKRVLHAVSSEHSVMAKYAQESSVFRQRWGQQDMMAFMKRGWKKQ
jgi:ethylmalonyl-CoA/methylmalonyl-CoA decarboxylase